MRAEVEGKGKRVEDERRGKGESALVTTNQISPDCKEDEDYDNYLLVDESKGKGKAEGRV